MSFRARGFEREVWGGNRGFEFMGLKLLPATSGGKFFTFSTGGIVKWNILLYDGLRFCWQAWYFSQTWDRKVELLFPHSHMQLLWSSLYDFFWRWIVVWGRIKHWKLFWSESELGWRWLNDEVIQAVIVKTIRRMPKCTFKMQFQYTFAWMICLNSLFFLRERQPTVMKFVWEKLFWFE